MLKQDKLILGLFFILFYYQDFELQIKTFFSMHFNLITLRSEIFRPLKFYYAQEIFYVVFVLKNQFSQTFF